MCNQPFSLDGQPPPTEDSILDLKPAPANTYQIAGGYDKLDAVRPGARAEAIRLITASLQNGFGHEYVGVDKYLDPIRVTAEFKRVLEGVRSLHADAGWQ